MELHTTHLVHLLGPSRRDAPLDSLKRHVSLVEWILPGASGSGY